MLRGSRTKQPSPVPVRLTNRWKARTKKNSVSPSHVHTSKVRETTFRSWPQSFRKVVRLLFDLLNKTQNKEAHKWTEGTPSFWRRHNMFKLWHMSKDSDRPTQTQKETQGALPTHSHTISPNTSLSSKVTARPCREKGFFVVTIPEQESCSGTVKTAKEVSSANLSSLNTHPSFLGIKCPLLCGSLMPPVLAPNPPRKETPHHLTNLPNDFKSEVIDVVLVIFKRRRAFTSCPLIATAAPNRAFWVAIPPHVSQLRTRVTVQPKGILLSHHVEADQGTCFHCFGWDAGPEFYQPTENHRFFLKEEEELAIRTILLRNISMRGSCV